MDKKEVMQELLDNRVKVHADLVAARDKLHDLEYDDLYEIQDSLRKDIDILKQGEPFWDGLTNERIMIEQEDCQLDKTIVDKICKLINELEEYTKIVTLHVTQ